MKRLVDIVLTVAFAPLWAPLAAFVALAVRAKLGRPVLFVQERAGKGGRPFRLFKFRTMLEGEGPDAERLTQFGRALRASSLDELPELWNVLKGEMSLVGPRPLPVRYLPRYSPEQNRRHEVLPGITGWAQVNGRNALDWETKFRYDVDYVDSRSLCLDAKILVLTLVQVFRRQGIAHDGEATMSEFGVSRSSVVRPVTPDPQFADSAAGVAPNRGQVDLLRDSAETPTAVPTARPTRIFAVPRQDKPEVNRTRVFCFRTKRQK